MLHARSFLYRFVIKRPSWCPLWSTADTFLTLLWNMPTCTHTCNHVQPLMRYVILHWSRRAAFVAFSNTSSFWYCGCRYRIKFNSQDQRVITKVIKMLNSIRSLSFRRKKSNRPKLQQLESNVDEEEKPDDLVIETKEKSLTGTIGG